MAVQCEGGGEEEVKTHFTTREGLYKLMSLSEYSKRPRVTYNGQSYIPVKVSFININDVSCYPNTMCFNIGKELYVYDYDGVRQPIDWTNYLDKRTYKGTLPSCHDFNYASVMQDKVLLLIGFTAGQIQLIDPIKKKVSKIYNEERFIDNTKVTCIKWMPGSTNQFLVSHGSGHMYVYNEELPSGQTPPIYLSLMNGVGYSISTCKARGTHNPLYCWQIGSGAINEFAFSPCSKYLAVVSEDGHMRVFDYRSMELKGTMRSYFGGLLCVCWSPDSKYIVTGGEDDLVTVWSMHRGRVVCRGHGHKSWVNFVAFDEFTCLVCDDEECEFNTLVKSDSPDLCGENGCQRTASDAACDITSSVNCNDLEGCRNLLQHNQTCFHCSHSVTEETELCGVGCHYTTYRFGSVGQDTKLCLWELTEDTIRQSYAKYRGSIFLPPHSGVNIPQQCNNISKCASAHNCVGNDVGSHVDSVSITPADIDKIANSRLAVPSISDLTDQYEKKQRRRNFSFVGRSANRKVFAVKSSHTSAVDRSLKLYGTPACPKLNEVPLLEALVCKKVAHERLNCIVFQKDCIVTTCQEGIIYIWARPGINVS